MDKQTDLISRLQDEADLCRNDGASDIAALLDEATEALRVERVVLAEDDGPTDADIGRQWRENSSLEKWFPITAERLAALEAENAALKRTRMREDNERLRAALVKIEAGCCIDPRTVAREALGPNARLSGPQQREEDHE